MAILKTCFSDRHPKIAILYINIGNAYNKLGMFEQALMNYEEALPIRQSIFGEDHPYTMKTKEKISEIQTKMKEQGNE